MSRKEEKLFLKKPNFDFFSHNTVEIIDRLMSTFFSGDRAPEYGYAERPRSLMRL